MKTCQQCGAVLTDDAAVCTACGEAQPMYTPPAYVPPAYQPTKEEKPVAEQDGAPVSMGRWLVRTALILIPVVGPLVYFIMLFVWAFGKKYNATSRNWAKAQLLFLILDLALSVVVTVLLYLFGFVMVPGLGVAFTAGLAEIFAPGMPLDTLFSGFPEMLSTIFGF